MFFTTNNTKKFNNNINKIIEEIESSNSNINTRELLLDRKAIPIVIRTFINKFKYNYFLRNTFKKVVKNNKLNNIGPEILIKDNLTRWLSTYYMIERFIYFREEISKVIEKANNLSNSKKKELNLESFTIEAEDWDYIIKIVDILEFFKKPTIKLQGSSSNVYTIVYISQLYIKLREIRYRVTDLFIKEGLKQAIDKLILYYPITSTNISKLKDLYLITVLDPHFKLDIFSTLDFNSEVISNIRLYFIEIYNNYKESLVI
jgi:hypothetical protein